MLTLAVGTLSMSSTDMNISSSIQFLLIKKKNVSSTQNNIRDCWVSIVRGLEPKKRVEKVTFLQRQ